MAGSSHSLPGPELRERLRPGSCHLQVLALAACEQLGYDSMGGKHAWIDYGIGREAGIWAHPGRRWVGPLF